MYRKKPVINSKYHKIRNQQWEINPENSNIRSTYYENNSKMSKTITPNKNIINEINTKNSETQTELENEYRGLAQKLKDMQEKIELLESKIRKENQKQEILNSKCTIKTIGVTTRINDTIRAEITSINSAESWGKIKLMSKNIVEGILTNGEILTLIMDTGSSQTLISESLVKENQTLSKLEIKSISQVTMYVGNDGVIKANKVISIPMTIQQYQFHIPFLIVPELTKRISIIGDDSLRKINATINLGDSTLTFDIEPVCLRATGDYILKSGTDNLIDIRKGENTDCPFSHQLPFNSCEFFKDKIYNQNGVLRIRNDLKYDLEIKKGDILAKTVSNYVDLNFCIGHYSNIIENDNLSNNTIINDSNECELPDIDINEQGMTLLDPGKNTNDIISTSNFNPLKEGNITMIPEPKTSELTAKQGEIVSKLNNEQKLTYFDRMNRYKWLNYDDPRLYQKVSEIIDDKLQMKDTILSTKEQDRLKLLINKYHNSFSLYGEIGKFKTKVSYKFKDYKPFAKRAFPIPLRYRDALEREVYRLKSLGILEDPDHPDSPVSISAGFPILKKDKLSVRLVIDFRELNQFLIKDNFRLLHFELLLRHISDASPKVISILDIDSAYFSLKVCDESKKHLGVAVGEHIYQLNSIPQGAKNSASEFTRHLDNVLKRHKSYKKEIFAYIDDIIIFSQNIQQHFETLQQLFEILQDEGIKLSLDKCNFAMTECAILGHIFICTEQGIKLKAARRRIDAIDKISIPKNLKQLRSFLGACNYLSRYIPNFRREAAILYQLTSGKKAFKFEKQHEIVFNKIKELVKSSQVIHLPDPNGKKRLTTDSSEQGYGAILFDVFSNPDGTEHLQVIAYDSKSYGNRTFRSSVHHELFALTSAIKTFKYFLFFNHFEVYTDSKALADIAKGRKSLQENPVLLRLYEQILGFDFTIIHVKSNSGPEIRIADAFSRLKIEKEELDPDIIKPIAYPSRYLEYMPIENEEIVLKTSDDNCYYNLRKEIKKPQRYGNLIEDEESEYEDEEIEELEQEIGNENKNSSDEENKEKLTEIQKLAIETEVPEYMVTPQRKLFEGVNTPDKVIFKNFPRQLDLNQFLNDVLQCCNEFDSSCIQKHELISSQRDSILYRDLYRFLKLDVLPSNRNLVRQVLTMAENITLVSDILCWVGLDKKTNNLTIRPVIPNNQLALKLINDVHCSKALNHVAVTSTYKILNSKYYIKNLLHLIKIYVRGCIECNLSKDLEKQGSGDDFKLCLSKGQKVMDCVYIDLKKFFKNEQGYEYLLVCVDSLSKFIMTQPVKNRSVKEIIPALLKLFSLFGFPQFIFSDLESSINSGLCKAFLKFLNIEIRFCQSLGHAAHGIVERGILRLTQRLQFLLAQKENHWLELSSVAAFSANNLIQSNGYTAFELMFGRKSELNESIKDIDIHNSFDLPSNETEYLDNLKQRFQEANEICKGIEIADKKAEMCKHRTRVKEIKGLAIFDLVYIISPRKANYMNSKALKLFFKKTGPYVIQNIFNQRVYQVRTLDNQEVIKKFHSNRVSRAYFLVGDKQVSNLITLIREIKSQGMKNKEDILRKLQETEQTIIQCNKVMNEDNIAVISNVREIDNEENKNDSCVITADSNEEIEAKIVKLKWNYGQLCALIHIDDKKTRQWHYIKDFPCQVREQIMKDKKLQTIGSLQKYRKRLDLL